MNGTDEHMPVGLRHLIGSGPYPPRVRWPEVTRGLFSLALHYVEEGGCLYNSDAHNDDLQEFGA